MAKDIRIIPGDGEINFTNAAGEAAGSITLSGDDLVLSNALGNVLFGDVSSDVYIGDGINNVDIIFEKSGEIRAETGVTGVTLTIGSSNTTVTIVDPDLTGSPTAPTASAGTNTTQIATTAFVSTAVSNLVDSAPGTLNTLNELAAALGDDASFSTTVSTALGNRLRVDTASQNLTATEKSNARTNLGLGSAATSASTDFAAASHTHSYLPLSGGTLTGNVSSSGTFTTTAGVQADYMFLTNDATDTFRHRIAVYDAASGVSYGMMLWNSNGTSGEWATMIYGPNQASRRISFGKVNSTSPSTHSHVTELAYLDLDNGNFYVDGTYYANGVALGSAAFANTTAFATSDVATGSANGLMSSTDKEKLDGIDSGANNYSLPLGTSTTRGGFKVGYTESGKNYPVELSNEQMYVNVPWTDTNTTYSTATSTTLGLVKIGYTENGKNYPVELSSGQMFVNVPWTDTNTTYSVATTTANGLMSSTDKSKLDGIAANANNYSLPFTDNSDNWDVAYGWGNHADAGYLTSVTNISGYSGTLLREDNRTISPSELTSGRMKFGFTSWGNNNSSPYADFLHLRSYTDSSGGSDNLVMFKKSGIGMRIWQQTYGSTTAYSSYADVYTTNDFSTSDFAASTHSHSAATTSADGFMSSTDKSKLDGIAASANNYSLPLGTSTTRGGFKVGYTESGKNYPVELSNEQMYVNVPWTDTNTTYEIADSNTDGLLSSGDYDKFTTAFGWGDHAGLYASSTHNHNGTYTYYDHIRSLGSYYINDQGSNATCTTAQFITEIETGGAFDSYTSVFKTPWDYAGNNNISDGGTHGPGELAGMSFITWTDNSNDTTRGNITVLGIAPNTGGSAGGVYVWNDQGSSYSPGWREIWTSATDGSGSGLDADLLDGNHASAFALSAHSHSDATTSASGFMSSTDKSKLDGIAANANNYSLPFTDNSDNWDVAYGWGNHADGGYLTSVPSAISVTSVAIGSTVTLSESSDRADLLYINSSTSGWGGLQIGNTSNEFIFSLMGDGTTGGIYDDQNGDWLIQWTENGGVRLYQNGGQRLETTSAGITVSGSTLINDGNSQGGTNAYSAYDRLLFSNSHSDTARGPNKITMYDSGAWQGGFGIHSGTVSYYSGDTHKWYKSGASSTFTQQMALDGSANLTIGGAFTGTKLYLNDSNTLIQEGANNSVNISTGTGSIDIGSMNANWVHMQADRDIYIYPGQAGKVSVDGNLLPYSDNAKTLGAATTRWSTIYGVTGAFSGDVVAYSDARVKENVETIETPLDKVMKLRGVSFNRTGEDRKNIGVIAQEIREVLPEVVHEQEDGMLAVAYGNIVGLLIEAMKEQQQQIEELKSMLGK